MPERRVIILGSTGSIGTQTLDVIARLNQSSPCFRVVGLAAGSNATLLREQADRFGVPNLALASGSPSLAPHALAGPNAALRLVRQVECDLVVAAMVGAAGLPATLAAIELGRDVALANKETLVAAGELVIPAALRSGSRLLPIDSEHAGVWQCLASAWGTGAPPCTAPAGVNRITLTASGGPFRTWDKARIHAATPDMALRHPTWSMGRKVTIDCASLMNKALELIEAHWLFGVGPDRLHAVIHPQSLVHAMVEFADGSTLVQLAPADMRCPIQLAITWPDRATGPVRPLDTTALSGLQFEAIDPDRFPAIALARRVIRAGGTAGAVLNAANEEAVQFFLHSGTMPFGRITQVVADALDTVPLGPLRSLADFEAADAAARAFVRAHLPARAIAATP
jgi:1-deoxy-D-xylulose-5-phosphate reductoisomerase